MVVDLNDVMMGPSPADSRPLFEALAAHDEAAFFRQCTAAGAISGRGHIRRFFERAEKKGFEAFPLGALTGTDGRAALICTLHQRSTRRSLGHLWIHLVADDGLWKAEGYSELEEQTGLFLSGYLPAIFATHDLPPSSLAQAWGEAVMARIEGAEDALAEWVSLAGAQALQTLPGGQSGVWRLLATHHAASIGRHLVGFMFESHESMGMEKLWFSLEEVDGMEPRVVGHDYVGGTKLLLRDHREVTASR